jgi:outer membrane protein assembly factor BamE (lipoprotein component of BamABCDE complex)
MLPKVTVVLAALALGVAGCAFGGEDFDSTSWQAAKPGGSCDSQRHRWDMLDDLTDNHLRVGMTQAEVRALLGQPDSVANKTNRTRGWDYALGIRGSCRYLYVGFDLSTNELREWHTFET